MKRICLTSLAAVAFIVEPASAERTSFKVTYLSAEHVYIDGGSTEGLQIGDRFEHSAKNGNKTKLVAIFVAGHSACCSVTVAAEAIHQGDQITRLERETVDSTAADAAASAPSIEEPPAAPLVTERYATTSPALVNGNVSYVLYYGDDRSASNLDFTQSTARLQLRARRLWGKEITFSLRSRGRFDHRSRDFSSSVTQHDWQNKLWECAVSYEDPEARVHVFAGRMLPRRLGAIGYLDGMALEGRFSSKFRAGVFGGVQPHWLYDDDGVALTKAGSYLTMTYGQSGQIYGEQSLAFIGEYHSSDVSRELIALQGRMMGGSRWGLYHTAEIDINRSWRKDKAGKTISMSSIHAGGYCQLSSVFRTSLSYDNRTSPWTYETRSTVDSLFDDRLRQGVNTRLDAKLPWHTQVSGSVGMRKRAGDPDPNYNYSLRLSRYGFMLRGLSAALQWAEFTGPFDHGDNYGMKVNYGGRLGNLAAAYDLYTYATDLDPDGWTNHRIEFSGQADIARHFYIGGLVQFMSGDDLKGTHLQTEFGVRF